MAVLTTSLIALGSVALVWLVVPVWMICSVVLIVGVFALLRPKPTPFHVSYPPVVIKGPGGVNIFPLIRFIFGLVPEPIRINFVVKMSAPKPNDLLRDKYDATGESPYAIKEVVPGRIWRVTYDVIMTMFASESGRKEAKAYGLDPRDPAYLEKVLLGAAKYGDEAVEVVNRDIQKSVEMFAKESFADEELLQLSRSVWTLNMFIVKLNGGGLLLYNPVRIREETGFAEWVDGLGKVEWIIMASGAHSLNLPPVLQRYPGAKVVGPPQVEAKLNCIDALPRGKLDFDSTDAEALEAANQILQPDGVKLYGVVEDVVTNSVSAVFGDSHLLTCDLLYTHADGDGFLSVSKERFLRFDPDDWFARLYKFHDLAQPNSPHGFLPAYRYQLMDRNGSGVLIFQQPAADGSSCKAMANSLRDLVRVKFEFANGVHFDQMTKEVFVDAIDKSWNWLDGKSIV